MGTLLCHFEAPGEHRLSSSWSSLLKLMLFIPILMYTESHDPFRAVMLQELRFYTSKSLFLEAGDLHSSSSSTPSSLCDLGRVTCPL